MHYQSPEKAHHTYVASYSINNFNRNSFMENGTTLIVVLIASISAKAVTSLILIKKRRASK